MSNHKELFIMKIGNVGEILVSDKKGIPKWKLCTDSSMVERSLPGET
jgi:hypothetical protein